MKLNATTTTILAALVIAAIVALTVANIAVPSVLTIIASGLVGGHLALQVPGVGTVSVATTPTAVKEAVTVPPSSETPTVTA